MEIIFLVLLFSHFLLCVYLMLLKNEIFLIHLLHVYIL